MIEGIIFAPVQSANCGTWLVIVRAEEDTKLLRGLPNGHDFLAAPWERPDLLDEEILKGGDNRLSAVNFAAVEKLFDGFLYSLTVLSSALQNTADLID